MNVFQEQPGQLELYTSSDSRDGAKIAIALEELNLPYEIHRLDDPAEREKVSSQFHGHIPVLTDTYADGNKLSISQTGSILQYLVNRYDNGQLISYPKGSPQDLEVNNWLFFQVAKLGPSHGEAHHFSNEAPEKIPYAIDRYKNEMLRLYMILDKHLAKTNQDFLADDKCTIADIAHYPGIAAADAMGVDIESYPNLTSWYNRMSGKASVEKGMAQLNLENTEKK